MEIVAPLLGEIKAECFFARKDIWHLSPFNSFNSQIINS